MLPAGSSGGSGVLQPSYSLSLQEQQALASGQLPSLGGQQLAYVEIGSAGGLPIIQPQFAAVAMQPAVSQPSSQPSSGQQQSQQRGPAASRASKPRPKRPYKPPHQVAQERKLKDEANVSYGGMDKDGCIGGLALQTSVLHGMHNAAATGRNAYMHYLLTVCVLCCLLLLLCSISGLHSAA